VNLTLAPLRSHRDPASARRRALAVDAAIVLSAAAGFAHLVAAPSHYTWWPASGVFFVALGVAQLGYAVLLWNGANNRRFVQAGIWATVGVILLYVASRTVGLPMTPPVPSHGGRWVAGRSMVPNGDKFVAPIDLFTLVAELLVVVTMLAMLPTRSRQRTTNGLMGIGVALWGAAFVFLF